MYRYLFKKNNVDNFLFSHVGGLVAIGRVLALSVKSQGFESPVWSSQRLKNWHLLLPTGQCSPFNA